MKGSLGIPKQYTRNKRAMKIKVGGGGSHEEKVTALVERLKRLGFNAVDSHFYPEPPCDLFFVLYCGDQSSTCLPHYNLEQYMGKDADGKDIGVPVILIRCGHNSKRLNLVGSLTIDSSDEELKGAIEEATKGNEVVT